jgi:hypothetical protein
MKKVIHNSVEYRIYDNEQEFVISGQTCKPLFEAQAGDYVRFNCGSYVPVVLRHDSKSEKRKKIIHFTFPLFYYQCVEHRVHQVRLVYKPQSKVTILKLGLRDKFFVQCLVNGFDLILAAKTSYKKDWIKKMRRIFDNDLIFNFLKKEANVKRLGDSLVSQGYTIEHVARDLKAIIEGNNPAMRKWALEIVMKEFKGMDSNDKDIRNPASLLAEASKELQGSN